MRKFIKVLSLVAYLSTVGVAASFAKPKGCDDDCGGGAPAPAIGAGVLGLLVAGGLAAYIRARRRD